MDLDVVEAPPGSKKVFKAIRLDNDLTAILISEPRISSAAVAMLVRCGSFRDPEVAMGLAHLLEHLVFEGSPEYPDCDELSRYAHENGGDANAHTELDYTMFSLDVRDVALQGGLERFSKLFTNPSLGEEVMKREIKLMDAEFELSRQTDLLRLEQLMAHGAPKSHPFNRFTWGNHKSLSTARSLHDRLTALFISFYVGATMNLVVHGGETLEKLQEWVISYFSGIKRIQQGLQTGLFRLDSTIPFWDSKKLYILKALEDDNILHLTWRIPPQIPLDSVSKISADSVSHLYKPEIFLEKVLGHRSEGSLYSLFKNKGWITSLDVFIGACNGSADPQLSIDSTSIGRLFTLFLHLKDNITTTEIYDIVTYVYKFLSFVTREEAPSWIMQEYFEMSKKQFESFDDYDELGSDALSLVQRIAANMLHYPLKHVLSGDYINLLHSKESVLQLLHYFDKSNLRLDFIDKSLDQAGCEVEPWFNSFYTEVDIPCSISEGWRRNNFEGDHCFRFPPKNRFLPSFSPTDEDDPEVNEDDSMDEDTNDEGDVMDYDSNDDESVDEEDEDEDEDELPHKFVHNPYINLWRSKEEGLPTINFCVHHDLDSDLKNQLYIKLYVGLLKDSLADILYQGAEACLETSIETFQKLDVAFEISGFKDKLSDYISEIWNRFITFSPEEILFQRMKEVVANHMSNCNNDIKEKSANLMLQCITKSCYDVDNMRKKLSSICYEKFCRFVRAMRSKMFIEGVIYGDLSKGEAVAISTIFGSVKIPLDDECVVIRRGTTRRHSKVKIKTDLNSHSKVCYQIGKESFCPWKTAVVKLFETMVANNLYNQLRAQETLGYSVGCEVHSVHGINRFIIDVSSSEYDPQHLLDRIFNYVETVGVFLEGIDDVTFETCKTLLGSALSSDDGSNLWDQIAERRFYPGFSKKVISELRQITKIDVIDFYKKYFKEASTHCRRLAVCIWGCNTDSASFV